MAALQVKNIKVHYFPFHGRAAAIRLILHAGGIEYEDAIIQGGPRGEEFAQIRFTELAPMGSLPTISYEVDQKTQYLTQSNAQLVFAASLGNRWFESPLDQARGIEYLDLVEDLFNLLGPTVRVSEEKQKEMREELSKEGEGKIWHWIK